MARGLSDAIVRDLALKCFEDVSVAVLRTCTLTKSPPEFYGVAMGGLGAFVEIISVLLETTAAMERPKAQIVAAEILLLQASVLAGIPLEEATVQFRKRLTDGGLGEFATKIQVQPI